MRGIHQTKQYDFNVGVQFDDLFDNAQVVNHETSCAVSYNVSNLIKAIFYRQFFGNNFVKFVQQHIVNFKDDFFNFFIFHQNQSIFQGYDFVFRQRCVHYANNTRNVLYQVCAEGSVTNAKRDNISFFYAFNVIFLQFFYGCKTILRTNTRIIDNLVKPTIRRHITAIQQIEQVFSTKRRNCQLVVFNRSFIKAIQPRSKLICIGCITINTVTFLEGIASLVTTLSITSKTVAVGHGVTDGNVVDYAIISNGFRARTICRHLFCFRECFVAKTECHAQCKDTGNGSTLHSIKQLFHRKKPPLTVFSHLFHFFYIITLLAMQGNQS